MNIELKVVNRSESAHQTNILLFQRNLASNMDERPIAWKVIRYCGRDCYHPVTYSTDYQVSINDEFGNYSPKLPITSGHAVSVSTSFGGRRLVARGSSAHSSEFEVYNDLLRGAVDVNIYSAQLLVARRTCVIPGQKATFSFKPQIWIGVASEVEQSSCLRAAVLQGANAHFSLVGVRSAELVITGGGGSAFSFAMKNINGEPSDI